MKFIECVPNFSEGQDKNIIDALAREAGSVPGAALADYSADSDHNRSVFTVIGEPEAVAEAAFRLCGLARDRIDLTRHRGVHPRMGAADVVPFVPVRGASMAECVELSKRVAQRIWRELGIPVFLYEESAACEGRRNLAGIRRGAFEGMPGKLLLPDWAPDFGERRIHPTAGVVAVGARKPLVAFNVNLNTGDVEAAKAIARRIRGSSGGLAGCKALGLSVKGGKTAQVSMNLVDLEVTPIHAAYEAVCREAEKLGISVAESELVGLSPSFALVDCAARFLNIRDFDRNRQVLENHI